MLKATSLFCSQFCGVGVQEGLGWQASLLGSVAVTYHLGLWSFTGSTLLSVQDARLPPSSSQQLVLPAAGSSAGLSIRAPPRGLSTLVVSGWSAPLRTDCFPLPENPKRTNQAEAARPGVTQPQKSCAIASATTACQSGHGPPGVRGRRRRAPPLNEGAPENV